MDDRNRVILDASLQQEMEGQIAIEQRLIR